MKPIAIAVSLTLAAACHATSSAVPSTYRVSYGDFRFQARMSRSSSVEGTISVAGDEIQLDTKDIGGFTVVSKDPKAQIFKCGDSFIRAQKMNGGWEFSYGTRYAVGSPIRLYPVAITGLSLTPQQ